MYYKYAGYKPRDDWILGKDVIRMDVNSKIPHRYYNSTLTKLTSKKE